MDCNQKVIFSSFAPLSKAEYIEIKNFLISSKKDLLFPKGCAIISKRVIRSVYAPVAQLDRVTGYEPVGQGFESLPAYQTNKEDTHSGVLFICSVLRTGRDSKN